MHTSRTGSAAVDTVGRIATAPLRVEKLTRLAAKYFIAADRIAEIEAALEDRIADLWQQAQAEAASPRAEAVEVILTMLAGGEKVNEVAELLDLSVADVVSIQRRSRSRPTA